MLSQIDIVQGRPQDALPEIELVSDPAERAGLGAIAYHALGRKEASDTALKELIAKHASTDPFVIAEVYAFRNRRQEAFEWLDRAYSRHNDGLIETKIEPLLKNLGRDSRYTAFLKKLNLPS